MTLDSLLAAKIPNGLTVTITIIDNNSTDGTRLLADRYARLSGCLNYLFEKQQGRSHALNAGISATEGDWVGIIDDDEEVDSSWYETAFSALKNPNVDFIGGPYVPKWSIPPPEWLPPEYGGVVGWVDGGSQVVPFDNSYPGILMGGNAVFKRRILQRVGPYATWLGRTDKRLMSGEDEDLYHRLLAIGAKGLFLPHLVIYHHVPPERLTRSYFRRWCFWRGVSLGMLDRTRRLPVPYLLGIPRWHYRKAAVGTMRVLTRLFMKPKDRAKAFASELAIWDCVGLFYGKHFYRSDRLDL